MAKQSPRRKSKNLKRQSRRSSQSPSKGEDQTAEEMGLDGATVDDAEQEFVTKICEEEVLHGRFRRSLKVLERFDTKRCEMI